MKSRSNSTRIYLENSGCSRRSLDTTKLQNYFLANNCVLTKKPAKADYILLSTCSFTKEMADVANDRIKKLKKHNVKIILVGCLSMVSKEGMDESFRTVPASRMAEIDNIFPSFKIKYDELPDANVLYPKSTSQRLGELRRTMSLDLGYLRGVKLFWQKRISRDIYNIRVCWGCVKEHCTYCAIWQTVGTLKSKPISVCVDEFKKAINNGHKNIMLVADNLGAYGLDINFTFDQLLEQFTKVEGDYSIALDELHPRWIIKYIDRLVPLLKSSRIKMISTPLQSGSDRILRLMNRRHTTSEIREAIMRLRDAYPKLRIQTHIIIGFPSETEDEFDDTLDIIKKLGIELVHIFTYSRPKNNNFMKDHDLPVEIFKNRLRKAKRVLKMNQVGFIAMNTDYQQS